MSLLKKYYSLKDVAGDCKCSIDDLLHFGKTGQLQMCVDLPPTYIEITRHIPISELDENSEWAKLINEPHEDSEQAKGEDPLEFIHVLVKCPSNPIVGPYYLFAGAVTSICRGESIESVHDGNFDTNRTLYRFLNDNGSPANKKFNVTDIVIPYEEKLRFEEKSGLIKTKTEMGTRERENLLRLIGALIRKSYNGNRYRKADGSPNADAISTEFRDWLTNNGFTETGMSARKLANIIPEAGDLFMQNKK